MFQNRELAAFQLSYKLINFQGKEVLVLGLTKGGVVIAYEVAKALKVPWDILVIKKIGSPGSSELAIGAVGPDGVEVWDEGLCKRLNVSQEYREKALEQKLREREEEERLFRQNQPSSSLRGKIVILVDDGIATGATTWAAAKWVRTQGPAKIVLAVPVASPEVIKKLKPLFEEIVCLEAEPDFWAVGQFYDDFPQVRAEEIIQMLKERDLGN